MIAYNSGMEFPSMGIWHTSGSVTLGSVSYMINSSARWLGKTLEKCTRTIYGILLFEGT